MPAERGNLGLRWGRGSPAYCAIDISYEPQRCYREKTLKIIEIVKEMGHYLPLYLPQPNCLIGVMFL